jgi:hypothetical protein
MQVVQKFLLVNQQALTKATFGGVQQTINYMLAQETMNGFS